MTRSFYVEITETVKYAASYTLETLAEMLDIPLADLEAMSDEQIADLIADLIDGDEQIEEYLQSNGDVQGSSWVVTAE